MAERETKTGALELNLGPCVRFDVVHKEYAGAPAGKKIGEADVYSLSNPNVGGSFFYKEVYSADRVMIGAYMGPSEEVIPGRETLGLMEIVGIKQGHVTLTNRREVKDG